MILTTMWRLTMLSATNVCSISFLPHSGSPSSGPVWDQWIHNLGHEILLCEFYFKIILGFDIWWNNSISLFQFSFSIYISEVLSKHIFEQNNLTGWFSGADQGGKRDWVEGGRSEPSKVDQSRSAGVNQWSFFWDTIRTQWCILQNWPGHNCMFPSKSLVTCIFFIAYVSNLKIQH